MHGDPTPWPEGAIELRRLCHNYSTVPTSYKLGSVVREGDYSLRISQVIEILKGRYGDEAVALKVLKVPRQDPRIFGFKRVSTSCGSPGERFLIVVLTDGTAALLGNGECKTSQA